MKFIPYFFWVLLHCLVLPATLSAQAESVAPPAPVYPVPTPEQLRWHETEMNAFVHFGINTFTDREWGYGDESPQLFNPSRLTPTQWAKTFKETGFKSIILTCKHHDGFCLWPSRYTDHSVKNSPLENGRGDVVREVSDACRTYGLNFGVYVSPWDRNSAGYGTPSYIRYYRDQLRELFTGYGPVFEMWFDGANGGDGYYGGARETRTIDGRTYYDWPATLQMVDSLQPGVIFFSDAGPGVRWVGNERGVAGETNWNTISADTLYPGKAGIEEVLQTGSPDGDTWIPAEVDVSIRPGWFYHPAEDSLVKSPQQLFDIYLTSVGRGSTLLLNVPPDRRGLLHEEDVRSLYGLRELLTQAFSGNLAAHAKVTASSYRGNAGKFAPANVADGDNETYWATDDAITTGDLEIDLGKTGTVTYILLQEYIKLGQRVKAFTIDVWKGNGWQKAAEGTTIGYKRIIRMQPVETSKLRVNITASKACPLLSTVEAY